MSLDVKVLLFLLFIVLGVMFEAILSRFYRKHKKAKSSHFTFIRYFYLLLLPLVGTLGTFYIGGFSAIKVFFLFAFLGPLLEWCIGFAYHLIVGQKLWTYHRYSVTGYTSILTIPLWGLAGILFYYLALVIR